MTSPWCALGNKISSLGLSDLSKHTHTPRSSILCVVLFPDSTTHTFTVSKHDAGHLLFDLACEHLGIVEKHYFSLQISEDTSSSPRWLDPNKPFKKQLKGTDPFYLIFRVRFFISDPNSLQHEQTRHFYFLQIKKDIREGRLKCPLSSAVVLASYAVQSELGDYVPETPAGYLEQIIFIPEQDKDFLIKVESLHPQHKGLSQSEAELCYLNTARTLDLYGVELHSARDANNPSLWVGIASGGVAMFCNLVCSSFFPWINVVKISFKRKRFFIHLRRKHGEVGQQVVSVSMPSSRACKNLWRSCVDHHTFYNRKNPHAVSKPRSVPLYRKLIGDVMWNPVIKSLSTEHLETKSLPSRSPPSTPNWRSPRLRHDFRKPRPSSVDNLTNEMSYVTESEDVFYTYRKAQEDEKTSSVQCHMDELVTGDEEDWQCLWDKNMAADGELLLVRISPDQDGKFGFNVKGGVDQKMPLAISHVNPNSPAGRCVPALLEGDQVLLINGRDISEHTHQQVVMFIKASRESHSKELALLVRRKGVSLRAEAPLQLGGGLNLQEEMAPPLSHPSGETLEESMARLERGLTSGTLLLQFEKLYRKKPGLLMSCAKLSENMDKNRYKDVLPYDITRVVLQAEEDNYINASHVKTEPAGAVLQYMAAQGPLPHTCTHFWRSVWEQGVTVIIMLTTLTERGRTKCHQYWPHPPEVKDYDYLQVCCHSEECNLAYVTRELTLTNTQLGQKRSITHLQYVAWPDHGVPEESSDFLDFVQTVRSKRRDTEPLMVHCSAGIGRTGVLITMETALILMESAKPVYPLEIVTSLREQRAMMVQTSCQFSFVCEAILCVYRERFKPSQTPSS
ncbi:tyrosine-protein phosphatase non-receptor type 3 [Colossoma macropomum]|uniref:tyrosine-protein phosphatase non-receptor type 3 n=1 Tax=Colossoma macropomum TaxID=42526 RepID=UPI0018653434|nr:tyrosine-protein phosphatase non-receptor type 3 [Colossoma macropomum]XP_036414109.1 tyrosine-protein phosphatase non-receptor type 3 [Colossoma macropomum]